MRARTKFLLLILLILINAVYFSYFLQDKKPFVLKPRFIPGKSVACWDDSFSGRILKCFFFSKPDALKEWDEKVFRNRSLYQVKMESNDGYLKAFSNNSSSGIFYRIGINPYKYPYISWKWNVIKFPDSQQRDDSTCNWIEKDDYAARFYVIFPSLFFSRTKSLEYVWDKDSPVGTVKTSPYFKNIKIIVAESGEENMGNWVFEERNIYDDYVKAFGKKPGKVGALAIMTDTDNSLSTAEAHYDEIRAGYKK